MDIKEFSLNLQKVYDQMSEAFTSYQRSTGLHCLPGCGRCCLNPDIEASPLEMLPFAWKVCQEGKVDEWIQRLENSQTASCLLYEPGALPGNGRCGQYEVRPSVCRMFGVAGYLSKNREVKLSICKFIKEEAPAQAEAISQSPLAQTAPVIAHWMAQLSQLHPFISQERLPINQAALRAIMQVATLVELQERAVNNCQMPQTPQS
jgi:uncharacterized protein